MSSQPTLSPNSTLSHIFDTGIDPNCSLIAPDAFAEDAVAGAGVLDIESTLVDTYIYSPDFNKNSGRYLLQKIF